jgi:DNA-binding MarR family transcriptional regulator
MGPTNNLSYLLEHLSAVLGKQTDQVLQEQLGIGVSQFKILMVLEQNPRVQQKVIADSLGQTEASISRQLKLLQTKGLVGLWVDPENRRKHVVVPTQMGIQITDAATAIIRRSFGPDFASLGEDQLMQLISGLQRLHTVMCVPGNPGACDHPLGL